MVRYLLRMHPQEGTILNGSSRTIYPLEVSNLPPPPISHLISDDHPHPVLHRQTVFYTPSTLTVSEGQKVTGRVTCAPNAKNNRDLDIAISYKTDQDPSENFIQYKMCVPSVLPTFLPTPYVMFIGFWFRFRLALRIGTLTGCQV